MSVAEINGARLFYEVAGSGDALVLVHAGIADARMWDAQFSEFARRYRTLRYDMRGYGKSGTAESGFSHHEDLRGLLDHLGVERARVVGCSMGGSVAVNFALENPGRVIALALVASAVEGFEPDVEEPEEWDELVAAHRDGDLARMSELEVRMWVDGPNRGPESVEPAIRDLVREMNLVALENEASSPGEEIPLEPPASERLSEITAPTLVIVGDEDQPEILETSDLLAKNIPNARKVTMSGAAHLPSMEKPEEFNETVLEYLENI